MYYPESLHAEEKQIIDLYKRLEKTKKLEMKRKSKLNYENVQKGA